MPAVQKLALIDPVGVQLSPCITTIDLIPPSLVEPRQRHMGTSTHQIMGACPPHDLMTKLAA